MFSFVEVKGSPSLKDFALWLLKTALVEDIPESIRDKVKKVVESTPNDTALEIALQSLELDESKHVKDLHRFVFLLADCYWVICNDYYIRSSGLAKTIADTNAVSVKLASIPLEIYYLIFEFLKVEDIINISTTTRRFRSAVLAFTRIDGKFESLGSYANYLLKPIHTEIGQHSKIALCVTKLSNNNLISGSADQTLKWWQLNEKVSDCKQTLEGHKSWVTCVCTLPGKTIVSGSDDGELKIWHLDKDEKYQAETIGKHGTAVFGVIYLPSEELVSVSDNGSLRVWRKDENKKYQIAQELKGHQSSVACVIRHPNGDLFSGSIDGKIKVWRLDNNQQYQEVQTLQVHMRGIEFVCSLSGNRFLNGARSGKENLKIWKLNKDRQYDFQQNLEGHAGPVNCALELPTREIISGSTDGKMRVWREASNKKYQCVRTLNYERGRVLSLNYFFKGDIVSSFYNGTLLKLSFPSVTAKVRELYKEPASESSAIVCKVVGP